MFTVRAYFNSGDHMQRLLPALIGGTTLFAAATAVAGNGSENSTNVLTLAVYGDAPYGTTPTDTAELDATPAFIDSINRDPKVDLVLHVGDIHSGKQYCTEAYNTKVFELWQGFKDPLIAHHPAACYVNVGVVAPEEWIHGIELVF
jgi:hypothetical protein